MYSIELPKTIDQIILTFRFLGLWDTTERNSFLAKALKTFHFSFYLLFVASISTKAVITDDSNEFVFCTSLSIIVAVHAYRMAYIIVHQSDTIELIDKIGTHSTEKMEEYNQVTNKIKKFIKFGRAFIVACTIEVSMFIVVPLVRNDITLIKIAFPFGYRRDVFWVRQVFLLAGGLYSVLCVCFSTIVWYLMVNASVKYEMLGNQLRNLGEIKTDDSSITIQKVTISETIDQKIYAEDLIRAIKTHQQINNATTHFSRTFSNLFFVQVVTSSLSICGFVYMLAFSSHNNLAQDEFFGVMLVYNLFDIFVLMYLGNEIKLSSDRLSYCLFESEWIKQTQKAKKCILVITEAVKLPRELIVGKLYPLNLRTFSSIVNGAYTLFNIAQNLKLQ